MKHGLLFLVILITSFTFSQNSINTQNDEELSVISRVYQGKSIDIENFTIAFIDVLQDSRCPKEAHCIWAGEVVILVDLYENGKKVERKKMTLNPKTGLQKSMGNLFFSDNLTLSVLNVLPYPKAENKTPLKNYYLVLNTTY
ncbi:hypothetical protein [Algibacter sp.]|uniref:hypothetical protein n=1 Tax=Algibacter sp. TaxID=1872428 RepID=UPI003C74D927